MKVSVIGIGRMGFAALRDLMESARGWNTELAKKFFSELAKRNLIINEAVTTPLS